MKAGPEAELEAELEAGEDCVLVVQLAATNKPAKTTPRRQERMLVSLTLPLRRSI